MDRFSYPSNKRRIPRHFADRADGLYAFDVSTCRIEAPEPTSHVLSPDTFDPHLQKHLQYPAFVADAINLSYFPQEGDYPTTVALDIAGTTNDQMPTQHITTLVLAKHTQSRWADQFIIQQSYGEIDEYEALLEEHEQFNMPLSITSTPQTIAHDSDAFICHSRDTVYVSKERMTYRHHKLLATALNALASSPHTLS